MQKNKIKAGVAYAALGPGISPARADSAGQYHAVHRVVVVRVGDRTVEALNDQIREEHGAKVLESWEAGGYRSTFRKRIVECEPFDFRRYRNDTTSTKARFIEPKQVLCTWEEHEANVARDEANRAAQREAAQAHDELLAAQAEEARALNAALGLGERERLIRVSDYGIGKPTPSVTNSVESCLALMRRLAAAEGKLP